jgi:hypothetical protein
MVDFNLEAGNPVVTTNIKNALQQIDILFDAYKGEVYGDESFGTDYARLLYDLKLSNESIKQQVLTDLNSLDLCGYTPNVNVYLLQGTERDIAIIDIKLYKNGEVYNKSYKIS